MQGNGSKLGLTVLFMIMSIYYLWPTANSVYTGRRMDKLDEVELAAYVENNFSKLERVSLWMLLFGVRIKLDPFHLPSLGLAGFSSIGKKLGSSQALFVSIAGRAITARSTASVVTLEQPFVLKHFLNSISPQGP